MVVVLSSLVGARHRRGIVWVHCAPAHERWSPTVGNPVSLPIGAPTFGDAQNHFYNARYQAAAALTLALRDSQPQDLANDELRTSALLFQLKGLLEEPVDKDANRKEADKREALRLCVPCPPLIAAFMADVEHGKALARGRIAANPGDDEAMFFLGKLDLNYVWLQLGPLGRRRAGTSAGSPIARYRRQRQPSTSARSWRAPGFDPSWTPGCPGRAGCWAKGAAGKRALATVGAAVDIPQISSRMPKRRSHCGTCRCGNATCGEPR
jgi:hypothetical protein